MRDHPSSPSSVLMKLMKYDSCISSAQITTSSDKATLAGSLAAADGFKVGKHIVNVIDQKK